MGWALVVMLMVLVGGFRGFAAVVIGAVVICCRGFAAER
jgi:hypothetical protein